MRTWLIIVICQALAYNIQGESYWKHHIRTYDIVDCFISTSMRSKRSSGNGNMKLNFDAEVKFKAFQTNFYLLLTEDVAFQKLKVESYLTKNITKFENIEMKVYEGIVKDNSFSSYVLGYLEQDIFVGTIKSNDIVYFVESANNFFPELTYDGKIFVYREQDVDIFRNVSYNGLNADIFSRLFHMKYGNDITDLLPKGIKKTQNMNEDYACRIELISDHTLYHYFKRNVNSLTAYLYIHGKYSDFVFRKVDFDGDGKRDRIRIIPEKIFIYKSINDPNYPMAKTRSMSFFLQDFSFRTQNYCLSMCMSYRRSSTSIIGEAFKAVSSRRGPPGGICQKPISYQSFKRSFNTAVITVQRDKGFTLPLAASLLAVAHEFGHSFGSNHDKEEDLQCSPGGVKGFYLMHYKIQMEMKPLSSLFSPCSKKNIAAVIHAKGECLKSYPATCGNGVQEGDEDCDCGKQKTCVYLDRCCTPFDIKPPEKGCTFRKSKGFACSPKEMKCCDNECRITKNTRHLCFRDDARCQLSYCDGENATCPEPKMAPDKYPCMDTSKSCSSGVCNSSVCLDHGLRDCVCKNVRFECVVCCQESGHCVTASSLGLLAPGGRHHAVFEGTPCNSKRYQCDGSGKCVNSFRRGFNSNDGRSGSIWWTIGGLTFALLVILTVLGYFVKQYITNK